MAGIAGESQTPYLHLNLGNDAVKNRNWAILDRRLYDLARGLIANIPAGGDLTGFYPDPIIKDGAMTPAKIAPGGDPGETLTIDAAGHLIWINSTAATTISPTPPTNPLPGQLWWRDDPDGTLFVYYQDVDSAQWVPATPAASSSGPSFWTDNGTALVPVPPSRNLLLAGNVLFQNNATGPNGPNSILWDSGAGDWSSPVAVWGTYGVLTLDAPTSARVDIAGQMVAQFDAGGLIASGSIVLAQEMRGSPQNGAIQYVSGHIQARLAGAWVNLDGASGAAGGDLTGSTYPNPVVAAGAITRAKTAADLWLSPIPTGADVGKSLTVAAGPTLAWTTVSGGSSPTGAAGGDLLGSTYPNPIIAPLAVTNAKVNDVAWGKITGAPAAFPPSGAATGDLSGSYPNPTVAKSTAATFIVGGALNVSGAVTLNGAVTANVQITATVNDAFRWGNGTAKGHLIGGGGVKRAEFVYNVADAGNVQDDATIPSWRIRLGSDVDNIQFNRQPAGSTTATTLLTLDATGQLTLPTNGANNALIFGPRTIKNRLVSNPTSDSNYWSCNLSLNPAASAWVQDDTSKPSWMHTLDVSAGGDCFQVFRAAPAGANVSLLKLDNAGNLTAQSSINFNQSNAVRGILATASTTGISLAVNNRYAPPVPTSPSWDVFLDTAGSASFVYRAPNAAAGTVSQYLSLNPSGGLDLSGATATKASGTTWANPSDIRIKKDIFDYCLGLEEIVALRPVRFAFNGYADTRDGEIGFGYLADEVATVMPECVSTRKVRLRDDTEIDLQFLDTSNISLAVVNAIKELARRVEALEPR